MTSANGNEKTTRVLSVVLIGLILALMSGTAWNALANADTNERVSRLEAQTEYIVKSLERIERAVVVKGDSR
jgi:hypothetical protein